MAIKTQPNPYTGSNSPEMAQQAVDRGYVTSTDAYYKASGLKSPKVSPAVVTSDQARDQVKDQKNKLDTNMTDRQRREEERKLERDKKKQQKQDRKDKDREFNIAEGGDTTQTDTDPALTQRLTFLQQQSEDIQTQSDQLNDRLTDIRANAQDPETNYLLAQVQQMYDSKRQTQEDQNAQLMRATEVSTIRTGIARLAQARSASIMSSEEDAGLSRLMEIEQNRIQAEVKAIQAYESGELDVFREQMKIFDSASEAQRQVAKDMYTAVQDSYKRSMEEAKETREAIKFEYDMQEKVSDNMANVLLNSGMDIGEDELAQVAAEYGLDPNMLLAKVNEQRIQQNKDMLDIELTRSQIRKINQDISESGGGGSGARVGQMLSIFGDTIEDMRKEGMTPGQIAEELAMTNKEFTGLKFDTKDYAALSDYLAMTTAVGSEDVLNQDAPQVNRGLPEYDIFDRIMNFGSDLLQEQTTNTNTRASQMKTVEAFRAQGMTDGEIIKQYPSLAYLVR